MDLLRTQERRSASVNRGRVTVVVSMSGECVERTYICRAWFMHDSTTFDTYCVYIGPPIMQVKIGLSLS